MFVNWGGGNAVFRGNDWAKNKNGTFQVKFLVDADNNRISVWIVDLREPSTATWVCKDQPYQNTEANGKNCAGLDFILKKGDKGSSGSLDYFKLTTADDFDVLNTVETLKAADILGENSAADDIQKNLVLPAEGENSTVISWESSDSAVISDNGTVTAAEVEKAVTLTAMISKNGKYAQKVFEFLVPEIGRGTRINYIGEEHFNYASTDDLLAGEGITVTTSPTGTNIATLSMRHSQAVLTRLKKNDAGDATITKLFSQDPAAYMTGKYYGSFEFTHSGSNLYVRLRSTQSAEPIFSVNLYDNGAMLVNCTNAEGGGEHLAFRGTDPAEYGKNKGGTFKMKFIVDMDTQKISVWVVDLRDPSTATWICENMNFQSADAEGKNCAGFDFVVQPGAAGSSGSVDYFRLLHEKDYEFLNAAEEITETAVLNGNRAFDKVKTDLFLPQTLDGGYTVKWSSTDSAIVSETGKVTRPAISTPVTVTAVISKDGQYAKVAYTFTIKGTEDVPEDFVLSQYDSEEAIAPYKSLTPDYEEKHLYALSAQTTPGVSGASFYTATQEQPVDVSEYEYLNFWIHSAGVAGQRLGFVFYDENNKASIQHKDGFLIDWTDEPGDWHLISLPYSDFDGVWDKLTRVRIMFKASGGVLQEGSLLNFEKFWLSAEKPEAPETPLSIKLTQEGTTYTASVSADMLNGVESAVLMIAEFNDDRLIQVAMASKTETEALTVTLKSVREDSMVKAMLYNSLDLMQPLTGFKSK